MLNCILAIRLLVYETVLKYLIWHHCSWGVRESHTYMGTHEEPYLVRIEWYYKPFLLMTMRLRGPLVSRNEHYTELNPCGLFLFTLNSAPLVAETSMHATLVSCFGVIKINSNDCAYKHLAAIPSQLCIDQTQHQLVGRSTPSIIYNQSIAVPSLELSSIYDFYVIFLYLIIFNIYPVMHLGMSISKYIIMKYSFQNINKGCLLKFIRKKMSYDLCCSRLNHEA